MKKLAIITTHPIQYNAPLFRLLSQRGKIEIKVFYTWEQSKEQIFDIKFGKEVKWDIPLLEGYNFAFVQNTSKNPNSLTFGGIKNPSLNEEIEDWQADALLVYGWSHLSHLRAMRYFKGKIPVYFRGDSTLIDEVAGVKTFLRRAVLSYIYRLVDFAFYVGTKNKEYFLKHGLKEKQLIFAPHAIDNNRFAENSDEFEQKAKNWRKELGLLDKLVVLYVGKFEKKKNPLLLIKVAEQLQQYHFLFVGNGEIEEQMKTLAGINVTFLPFQNQSIMPVVYRLGDVFVLPSQGPAETWGLAVNEAMACSKAVVVSNKVGCAGDLVKNNENGFVFDSNDIDDLKQKISFFDKKKAVSCGNNSLKKIKDWSFSAIANILENKINE